MITFLIITNTTEDSQERINNPCILCGTGFFILKQQKLNVL